MGHRYPSDLEARALKAKGTALSSDKKVRHITDDEAIKVYVESYNRIADAGMHAAASHKRNQFIGAAVLALISYALHSYDFGVVIYLVPLALAAVLVIMIFRDGLNDQASVDAVMERDRRLIDSVDQLACKRLLLLAAAQPE